MVKNFIVQGEISYGDTTRDVKLFANRPFSSGDINSIIDCIEKVTEDVRVSRDAINHASGFFGIKCVIEGFTISITDSNGAVIEAVEYNDESEVERCLALVLSMCN